MKTVFLVFFGVGQFSARIATKSAHSGISWEPGMTPGTQWDYGAKIKEGKDDEGGSGTFLFGQWQAL